MQLKASKAASGSRGWALFTVAAVLGLGTTIASAGFGQGARDRFEDARARLPPEKAGATPFPELTLARGELEESRRAVAAGDRVRAAAPLVRVLARADRVDASRTLAASVVAAKLFDGVADAIDAEPRLLDDPRISAALARSAFASARHPLEAERVHALHVLATVPGMVPVRTLGLAEVATTRAMSDVDVALREMESATLAGDLQACESASQKPRGLGAQVTVGPSICRSAQQIVVSGRRLRRLQAIGAAHAHRPSTRTARWPIPVDALRRGP